MAFWRKKSPTTPSTESPAASQEPGSANVESESEAQETASSGGWFQKLRGALSKTHQWLRTDIRDLWKAEGRLVDDDFLRDLFAVMIKSDMGGPVASQIRDRIGNDFRARKVEMEQVLHIIREEIRDSLQKRKLRCAWPNRAPP